MSRYIALGLLINLTPFRFLFDNPIPFISLPFDKGGGGNDFKREASLLLDFPQSKIAGRLRGALAPLSNLLPFPLPRGRGYRG